MDRLYEDHPDFVADVGGDLEPAGARLLGHDMAVVMSNTTKQAVQSILSCNTIPDSSDRLVEAIFRHIPGQNYERALDLLQNIKKGLDND
jgi:predicted nucleotidyltransferase